MPLTLNPLRPASGFPVATHAGLLCSVWQAAFGLPDTVTELLGLVLRRAYTACGWDWVTGGPAPGVADWQVLLPTPDRLRAVAAQIDHEASPDVDAFLGSRLTALSGDGAGLLLGGGHPVPSARLLEANVDVVVGDAETVEGRAFVAGAMLLQAVEAARTRASRRGADHGGKRFRHALLLADADRLFSGGRAGHLLSRLVADAEADDELVIVSDRGEAQFAAFVTAQATAKIAKPPADGSAAPVREHTPRSAQSLLTSERRTAACGAACTGQPCSRQQIRAGRLLAGAREAAWLRLWGQTLLLAFLTNRPLPLPPPPLRRAWAAQDARLRECALATVADHEVALRAVALRTLYQPRLLVAAMGRAATTLLDGGAAPARAGQVWVPPQLRWAHEVDRVRWSRQPGQAAASQAAPPLDFAIAGLPDWPGIKASERLELLLAHPLSIDLLPNRELVTTLLLGERDRTRLAADLASVVNGHSESARLREAGRLMSCAGDWLETVLSWPAR